MQELRRRILQCSLSLPLCLPAVLLAKDVGVKNSCGINFIEIKDNLTSPLLSLGDYLLVDTKVGSFQGEGEYLYPDWGQPRVYEIKEGTGGELSFYYPGHQKKLWSMSAKRGQNLFSGRALKVLSISSRQEHLDFLNKYDELLVPAYPI